ncbi:MAG: sulfotransferase domain-containing protein [Planctomycetota bacterium]
MPRCRAAADRPADHDARLPSALVLGPQRAGTTWVHEYLRIRGDVRLPLRAKETFFFDRHFRRGAGWYTRHFAPCDGRPAIEVASTYFHDPETPARIAATLGAPRLICTLRDPADRAYSLYRHLVRYGVARGSLRECFQADTAGLRSSSCYATVLQRWIDQFGADRVRLVFLEELQRDPDHHAGRVADAFGLPRIAAPASLATPVNAAVAAGKLGVSSAASRFARGLRAAGLHRAVNLAKRWGLQRLLLPPAKPTSARLCPEDRAWLIEQLRDQIDQLGGIVGADRDLSAWTAVELADGDCQSHATAA